MKLIVTAIVVLSLSVLIQNVHAQNTTITPAVHKCISSTVKKYTTFVVAGVISLTERGQNYTTNQTKQPPVVENETKDVESCIVTGGVLSPMAGVK
jgi:hypothetical protein